MKKKLTVLVLRLCSILLLIGTATDDKIYQAVVQIAY